MSLFTATIIMGAFLVSVGALLLWNGQPVAAQAKGFLRARTPTIILFGAGALWFLYNISKLGAADFGNIKHWLLILFGGVALGSFFVVRDFLAVRGAAILILLSSWNLLDAAYMEAPTSRLFLVTFVYLLIVLALYLGTLPFKLRDFFNWLFANNSRPKILGSCLVAYGLLLTGVALGY